MRRNDPDDGGELSCIYDGTEQGSCWGKIALEPTAPNQEVEWYRVPVCEGHMHVLLGGAYQPGPNLTVQ